VSLPFTVNFVCANADTVIHIAAITLIVLFI
jgi:hypothetical protein